MKKYLLTLLALVMAFSVGCQNQETSQEAPAETTEAVETTETAETTETTEAEAGNEEKTSITVKSLNGEAVYEEVEVPFNPEKIAVLDMAALDIIKTLGLEDRVIGTASSNIDYLNDLINKGENFGTLKQPDLEALMSAQPDLIIMGGRGGEFYSQLQEIAPTVRVSSGQSETLFEGVESNGQIIGSIFGKEGEVADKMAGFQERLDKIKEFATGKTAIIGLVTNGGFNVLGNDGRLSVISKSMGFENLGADTEFGKENSHGNEASFEFIVEKDPDYIFVLDRDSAIAREGAKLAEEIIVNDLTKNTKAYKDGNLVILENAAVWYLAEGGITAFDTMISDIEKVTVNK